VSLRFFRFNVVGALGIGVQLATAALLVGVLGIHYLVGTALAIEISLLHNFVWHERWTWRDRRPGRANTRTAGEAGVEACNRAADTGGAGVQACYRTVLLRCLAFHAGNGCVSIVGTLALLPFLVGRLGLHYLAANLAAIAATGILNFLVGDRLVFVRRHVTSA
jgi:putative flippase GtrA